MSIGIQLFNDRGELFYDGDYSDSVLSFQEKRVYTFSSSTRDIDLGVASNVPCLVFVKLSANNGYGIQRASGGRWLFSAICGKTTTFTLYIFTTLPQGNPAPRAYGVNIYDTNGNVVIHNNSRPLSCSAVQVNRDSAVVEFSYEPACTAAFLGAANAGGNQFWLFHAACVGTRLGKHQSQITGGIGGLGNYHSSVLVINSHLYD